MSKESPSPKIPANVAPATLPTSHTPAPKRKGPSSSPSPSMSSRFKKAWRTQGRGLSLKEYARKSEMGRNWLANKRACG